MASETETVASICKRARKELDKSWWEIDREFVRDLPTKILEAHDREVAPLRKGLERIRDMMSPFAHDPVTTNGYAYKIAVDALRGGNDGK